MIGLSYIEFYVFQMVQLSVLAHLGNLKLMATVSYSIFFDSCFFIPLIWAMSDLINAKISAPIARNDGNQVKRVLWLGILSYTILFAFLVVTPGIFSKQLFGLMKVHQDIGDDLSTLILWLLIAMYLNGATEILKCALINLGKTERVGKTSIVGLSAGFLLCLLFNGVLKLGFYGVLLGLLTYSMTTLGLNVFNFCTCTLPLVRSMTVR